MQLGSVRGVAACLLLLAGVSVGTARTAVASGGPALLSDTQASTAGVPLGPVTFPVDGDHPQPDTEIEPSIAVNPANPLNAVAAFQVDRIDSGGDADNGWATTVDGGASWTSGYLPGLTTRVTGNSGAFERASDAVVAFGPDNVVYANSLVFDQNTNNGLPSGMAINVSKDGGRTWGDPVFLEQDNLGGLNDKNWIVVDNGTGSGHHRGRVYVVWDRVAPMVYAYCDANCDQPANWSNAPQNNGAFYTFNPGPGIGSIPLVLPDGSLGVVFQGDFAGTPAVSGSPTDQPDLSPGNSQLMFEEAPQAGSVPFPAPLPFGQANAVGVASNQTNGVQQQRAGTLPTAAVDARTGQIYVGWEDGRFRKDGLNDAVFSTSTNGVTWSPAARINQDAENSNVDHYNTMLDVGPDGVVHAGYRQRFSPPGGLSHNIDTYYQESADHGATWTAPLKVNSVESDDRYAAFSRKGAFQGDYNQLAAATNGTTYVVREESYATSPGEPCNCDAAGNPSFISGNGHQHQFTWVAVVGAQPATTVPEAAWAPALLLLGAPLLGGQVLRRRRHRQRQA